MTRERLPGKYYLSSKLDINAPAPEVWKILADFSAVDNWAPQVTKSFALGENVSGVGAGRHCDIQGFGGIDEVVTHWDEGHGLVYKVTPLGPLGTSINRWTIVEKDEASSQVIIELGYDVRFGVFGKLLHKLVMRQKLETAFPKALEALKSRVETGKLVRPRRSASGQPQLISVAA